jgi:hypothetical protein
MAAMQQGNVVGRKTVNAPVPQHRLLHPSEQLVRVSEPVFPTSP